MDKNTIIGIVLIFAIIFGFSYFNKPSEEEIAAMQAQRDSIAAVEEARRLEAIELDAEREKADSIASATNTVDSARLTAAYGDFANAVYGINDTLAIETELLKLKFVNKGGRIVSAELKEYSTHDSLPLMVIGENESEQNFTFITATNRVISTQEMYFKPIVSDTESAKVVTMRLEVNESSFIDFIYTIPTNDYMTSLEIKANNMGAYLDARANSLEFASSVLVRQQEKGRKFEERYANLNYKYWGEDVDDLSESSNDQETLTGKVHWVAFKDHFFSTVHIAKAAFDNVEVESQLMPEGSGYIKEYSMRADIDFDPTGAKSTKLNTYFGPNKYKTLVSYDDNLADGEAELELEELVPLGWSLFRWVSVFLVIPLFNFFGSFMTNYGLIILLMTIVIKLILLPFTYKSYMSTAKMRVLKPQIDAINERIPADKAMERQQATMALYRSVGVSPMSGCLPMLLQMPILFAMFSFFPTAIELRQQGFLWADDLSTYDAILSWDFNIPLISSTFGNHISLFCLLMTITNIIYTKLNMANNANSQMAAMKWVMYLMPLMFLFMFNNYASGLSYYYFVSLLITIGQTYLFRLFVDEKKVLAKLEANKGKVKTKKKSGFMERLEKKQKEQMAEMKRRNKK